MKRIVVKIGSAVLTDRAGGLKQEAIAKLVEEVAGLRKAGHEVVLVSSGAVSLGRSVSQLAGEFTVASNPHSKRLLREQVLASVGQPKLMALYNAEFEKRGLHCAQLLTTRADFADRTFYLSLRSVTETLLRHGVVPIFNENDVLSPEELDFSDNDQLALMTAAMVLADQLVILTDVPGVYDRPPQEVGAKLLPEIKDVGEFLESLKTGDHRGKGGIKSKLLCAEVATSIGIPTNIASGSETKPLTRILEGEPVGTFFPAISNREEPIKAWLRTAAAISGQIVVSTYLAEILRKGPGPDSRTRSIIFAGIEEIKGDFPQKSVVEIADDKGHVLGRGQTRFSSTELRDKVAWYRRLSSDDRKLAKKGSDWVFAIHANEFVFV